ncbi:MAG: hypothetical protein WC707_02230 [Candidatus Babeliaceae bacterium]|jgi:hypothetical protein
MKKYIFVISLSCVFNRIDAHVILKNITNNTPNKILLYKAPFSAAYTFQRPFSWLKAGQYKKFYVPLTHNLQLKINTHLKDVYFKTIACDTHNNIITCKLTTPISHEKNHILAKDTINIKSNPAKNYALEIDFAGEHLEKTQLRILPKRCVRS